MSTIGIAELSHRGSELVRLVEEEGAEFDLTRQGRDIGVVLTRRSRLQSIPTASLAELSAALGENQLSAEQIESRLADVQQGRDSSGEVSGARSS